MQHEMFPRSLEAVHVSVQLDPKYGWYTRVVYKLEGEPWGEHPALTHLSTYTKPTAVFVETALRELLLGEDAGGA